MIYSPFGAVSFINNNPEVMNFQFPGQYFQLETGLAYNWHRHYDPTLGRYIQPDPLGLAALMSDGPSAYTYALSSPLVNLDRFGWQNAPYNRPPSEIPGGPWKWSANPQNSRLGVWVGPNNNTASWDDVYKHWDCDDGKGGPRQRYSWRGVPLDQDDAHNPGPMAPKWELR